jgi:3-dehydroquinate synthase
MLKVPITLASRISNYEISIGRGMLTNAGPWARNCVGTEASRAFVVSNPRVYKLYGDALAMSLQSADFDVSSFLMKDGERHKTLKTAESTLSAFSAAGMTRTDVVIALGGGVAGDLAGFAAAVYLRGVRFLQIPTTLLAMVDSSVGGKTGVNTSFGKNLTGAFHQPSGVLIDPKVLGTLPKRELTAGRCEMIKHGALAGRTLFDLTARGLGFSDSTKSNLRSEISDIENLIAKNVRYKASIVASDDRESSNRTDARSRKILNFGHTLAHALEKVTNYTYFRHGEAVGYGILFAAELSNNVALCPQEDVKLLNDVVHRAGALPSLAGIRRDEVLAAFLSDKKVISGNLQMVLLKAIGKPVIVADIPQQTLRKTLTQFLKSRS